MGRNLAGNTLLTAKDLSALNTDSVTLRDRVTAKKQDSLYHFKLSGRSQLSFNRSEQRAARVGLELFTLKGAKTQVLRRIGQTALSAIDRKTRQNAIDSIARFSANRTGQFRTDILASGEYYLRIYRLKQDTPYRLTLTSSAEQSSISTLTPTPNPTPTPTPTPSPLPISTVLYDGKGLPQNQSWLTYGQVPISSPVSIPPYLSNKAKAASQTPGANGVLFDSQIFSEPFAQGTTANTGYAGYSNYTVDPNSLKLVPVNSVLPKLDRQAGFSITFNLAINSETSNINRAGFSVLVVTDDQQAVELGFKSDRIFAQSSTFTAAETVVPTTSLNALTSYKLTVKGNGYQLFANQSLVLSGALQSYAFNPAASTPALPFNPYTTPDLLFFGDDTDEGRATVTLGAITLER